MEFKEIVEKRYATKKFDGKEIPEKDVTQLLHLIKMSASSFGIQPWKAIIIKDQETKDKLQAASWNQVQVGTSSHVIVFCANTDIKGNIDKFEHEMIKGGAKKESIQGYIQMMKDFEKNMPEDKKLIWAQKQSYLALANALNGAKSLGFDSCPMEGFSADEYSKILNLPANLIPTTVCPIGYAADAPRPKVRLSDKDLFTHL